METEINRDNDHRPYVGYDLMGFPYNSKYPPNKAKYGDSHDGYASKAEGVLFYDFAVMGYDVEFRYDGKMYYLINDGTAALCDSKFSQRYEIFDSPIDLIENLKIDGHTLLQLIPNIDDIEPV